MPNFYAVVVLEEWIESVKPYLEHLTSSDTSDHKGTAGQCLEELDHISNTMQIMQTDWAQGTFSTKQMHLMELITSYLELDVAKRRFTL